MLLLNSDLRFSIKRIKIFHQLIHKSPSIMRLMTTFFILYGILIIVSANSATQDSGVQLNTGQIWGFGLLAIIGVSLIGFFAAGIMVCLKQIANQTCFDVIIRFFFTLACGALLGDSIVHILPEAYTTDGAISWIVAVIFIAAILFALLLEKLFHVLGIAHTHWVKDGQHDSCDGDQDHNHKEQKNNVSGQGSKEDIKKTSEVPEEANQRISIIQSNKSLENMVDSIVTKNQAPEKKSDESQEQQGKGCCSWTGKGTSGYLNLIGSLIHNFIDGLALGVAFATGKPTEFVPLLIAIVAHEIPRELGDVAILMKNNFNEMQTVCCNGVVNLISIIGGIIGLAVSNLDNVAQVYILVFVAGSFIYIAADIWRNMFKNKGCGKNIVELFGFILGCVIMFLLLLIQKKDDEQAAQQSKA